MTLRKCIIMPVGNSTAFLTGKVAIRQSVFLATDKNEEKQQGRLWCVKDGLAYYGRLLARACRRARAR